MGKRTIKRTTKRTSRNPKKGSSSAAILARQREDRAVGMRLDGFTLDEIATELGYSVRESARAAIIRAMGRLAPIENLEELRRQEVARTYEVEREAWEKWHRSTEDSVKETVKSSAVQAEDSDGPGNATELETTVTREGQSGNPALLDKILKAMERRAKLLGLDSPERVDINAGMRVIGQDRATVLQDALKRLKAEK